MSQIFGLGLCLDSWLCLSRSLGPSPIQEATFHPTEPGIFLLFWLTKYRLLLYSYLRLIKVSWRDGLRLFDLWRGCGGLLLLCLFWCEPHLLDIIIVILLADLIGLITFDAFKGAQVIGHVLKRRWAIVIIILLDRLLAALWLHFQINSRTLSGKDKL